MKHLKLTAIFLLLTSLVYALETTNIQLRQGFTNDGEVTITRDEDGNLIFDDICTESTTLSELKQTATSHSALTGLDVDSHPHYLNQSRHSTTHDNAYNSSLTINTDTNGNTTIGDHTNDDEIHPNRINNTTIGGVWDFTNGVSILQEKVLITKEPVDNHPTIIFNDKDCIGNLTFDSTGNGILSWDKQFNSSDLSVTGTLSGFSGSVPTAQLEGFSSIQGIASTDLLSATRQESISAPWSFQSKITANQSIESPSIILCSNPSLRMKVQNINSSSVSVGDPMLWAGYYQGEPQVIKATSAITTSMPLAGFAAESALTSGTLTMHFRGTLSLPVSNNFALGTSVGWDGSGICDVSTITNGKPIGTALQAGIASSNAVLMIDF